MHVVPVYNPAAQNQGFLGRSGCRSSQNFDDRFLSAAYPRGTKLIDRMVVVFPNDDRSRHEKSGPRYRVEESMWAEMIAHPLDHGPVKEINDVRQVGKHPIKAETLLSRVEHGIGDNAQTQDIVRQDGIDSQGAGMSPRQQDTSVGTCHA